MQFKLPDDAMGDLACRWQAGSEQQYFQFLHIRRDYRPLASEKMTNATMANR